MWQPEVSGSIEIDRPVDEVFDFVVDERNEPLYNPTMTASAKITPGPIGVGTRFAATVTSFGHGTSMVVEFTGVDRPHRIESTTNLEGMLIVGGMTFEAVPAGTRMSWRWQLRPTGALRLLKPLMALLGQRNERRIWTGLKEHLESRTPTQAAS